MKKIFLPLLIFLLTASVSFGQADTLLVPFDFGGSAFGSINKFILGDTTATGERNNPERYYKLEKDKIYFLDGIFFSDFDLRLIADDVEDGEKPPIVASTSGADGVIQLIQFKLFGNGYVKNIIFQMTPPSGNGESNASFFLSGEGKNYEFDNVMVEWGLWTAFVTEVPVNKVVIRNCYFKNPQHKTNIWNGRGFGFFQENPADSVIMQNNTFFNMNAFAFFADISSIPPDYLLFDHNTIANSMKFPIHSFWLPEAIVTNNLFYNSHAYAENATDVNGQDPEGLKYGIINIANIPSDLIEYYDIAEGDRKYTVANNGFFYDDDVKAYWTAFELDETPFMNERVIGMFGDDATYPNLEVSNTITGENPNFVNAGEGTSKMIHWMTNKRSSMVNTYWGWDSDEDKFAVAWPLVEDLSYSNATLKTAAENGYPVGDLNWWPANVKEDWEDGVVISTNTPRAEIKNIIISPSPASDHLTINYELLEKSDITITVYNLKGSKINTIFKGAQVAGARTFEWSIDNSVVNGIYLIRISDGIGSFTKKVIIQK